MNLAMICFIGTEHDLVLRKYTDWFLSGFDIGLTNHSIAFMHEQTILDNPLAMPFDLVHIVFEENSLTRVLSTILKILHLKVFSKTARVSFTCIIQGRKNTTLDATELSKKLTIQMGERFNGQFNGSSYWSIRRASLQHNNSLLTSIQYRKWCYQIENEGMNFGKSYTLKNPLNLASKSELATSVTKNERTSKVIGETV